MRRFNRKFPLHEYKKKLSRQFLLIVYLKKKSFKIDLFVITNMYEIQEERTQPPAITKPMFKITFVASANYLDRKSLLLLWKESFSREFVDLLIKLLFRNSFHYFYSISLFNDSFINVRIFKNRFILKGYIKISKFSLSERFD